MEKSFLVSVIIVTYEGKNYADKCVESVLQSRTKSVEVVVVDNGSTDGTVAYLNHKYAAAKQKGKFLCIGLDKNYGPAMARNIGVKSSQGQYLGFLDNDTVVDPNWANEAVKAFKKDKNLGAIQCKLLVSKQAEAVAYLKGRTKKKQFLIDYVGEHLGQNGFLVQRCQAGEIDHGQYDQPIEILAAKSAGMFISRKVFDKAGGFDGDYFIYVEETDLGWRCWLAGYQVRFVPQSKVYHEFGTSTLSLGQEKKSYQAKFHGTKNYLLTHLKNLQTKNLIKILTWQVILWSGLAWYKLVQGNYQEFWWINKGILWNVVHLRSTIRKRQAVSKLRKVNDDWLFDRVMVKKPLSYFLSKAQTQLNIGNAKSF